MWRWGTRVITSSFSATSLVMVEPAPGSPLADPHRRHQLGIGADEDIVLDDGLELVHPVVIAGDGASTDVHLGADVRIPR